MKTAKVEFKQFKRSSENVHKHSKLCAEVLKEENAHKFIFDRVHRKGSKSAMTLHKFHYYSDRENDRQASFQYANQLKVAKMGVGAELFKGIRNGRKPLYPVMKKAKDEGKLARFTGKKLYINEEEYISRSPMDE